MPSWTGGTAEVKLGELAQKKGSGDEVKQCGRKMVLFRHECMGGGSVAGLRRRRAFGNLRTIFGLGKPWTSLHRERLSSDLKMVLFRHECMGGGSVAGLRRRRAFGNLRTIFGLGKPWTSLHRERLSSNSR